MDALEERDEAFKEIQEHGSDIAIQKSDTSTYDIPSGTTIATDGATLNIKGLIESYESGEITGIIQIQDLKIMIAENNLDLDIANDTLIFSGTTYNILNVTPFVYKNVNIFYTLQVRR